MINVTETKQISIVTKKDINSAIRACIKETGLIDEKKLQEQINSAVSAKIEKICSTTLTDKLIKDQVESYIIRYLNQFRLNPDRFGCKGKTLEEFIKELLISSIKEKLESTFRIDVSLK